MKTWMGLAVASAALMLSACGGGGESDNAAAQEPQPVIVQVEKRELRYGEHPRQRAVLYEPVNVAAPRELIVWVHGGGWFGGAPDADADFFLKSYMERGHPVFSIGYRLKEDGVFPNAEQDVVQALQALEGQPCALCEASEHWGKIRQWAAKGYVLAGGSAGGSLALLGAGQVLTEREGRSALRCAASLVGVLDVRDIDAYGEFSQTFIGDHLGKSLEPHKLAALSVPHYIENNLWTHADKIRWAFAATRNDLLVPWSTVEPVITLWQSRGLDTVAKVIDGTPDGGHALSKAESAELVDALMQGCLQ